jgi:hypothetical protein
MWHGILAVDTNAVVIGGPAATPAPLTWPHQADLLTWGQNMEPGTAAILVMMGLVYLLFGYKIFKALVIINAAVLGARLGIWISDTYVPNQTEAAIALGIICAGLAAAITWPTMRYAVAVMGGLFGVLLGTTIWQLVGLDEKFIWAGSLIGLISLGLLSFILFRGSVIMYTSLQGSFMLVFGILGLVWKYHAIGAQMEPHLKQPLLLPAAIFIPAVAGWIFQHHHTAVEHAEKK